MFGGEGLREEKSDEQAESETEREREREREREKKGLRSVYPLAQITMSTAADRASRRFGVVISPSHLGAEGASHPSRRLLLRLAAASPSPDDQVNWPTITPWI